MAITTTITARVPNGDRQTVFGKSVLAGGVTEGDVVVNGLKRVEMFTLVTKKNAQQGVAVNEDFPLAHNTVTCEVEVANDTFYWKARGLR